MSSTQDYLRVCREASTLAEYESAFTSAMATLTHFLGCKNHQEVQKAYKRLAREHHPDAGGSEAAFVELTDQMKAWEELAAVDKERRPILKKYQTIMDPPKRKLPKVPTMKERLVKELHNPRVAKTIERAGTEIISSVGKALIRAMLSKM